MITTGLRFVESTDRYSVYERNDGTEVYLSHGFPRVYLVEYDRDWMLEQWEQKTGGIHYRNRREQSDFLDWLREHVLDPDVVDDINFCENCEDPDESDNGQSVGHYGDTWACETCIDSDYSCCNDCDDIVKSPTWIDDEAICSRCLDNYNYCDSCEEYYHHDSDEHYHDDEGCSEDCSSPAMTFSMPNNGELLSNDDRVTVTLPAGMLDDEGASRIRMYLRDIGEYEAAAVVNDLGREWQTSEGNLPKRLSRALYKRNGGKLSAEMLSRVGNIASEHSRAIDFQIEITRDLNLDASDFYHEGSCWWGEYSAGRCALKTNGGFGLRTFSERGSVQGRAWVMPLRVNSSGGLVPTFDAEGADAYVVFNGYGDLEGYNPARIIAHLAGESYTYRKIGFMCSPMFINSESAYLLAPEEIAEQYATTSLRLSVSEHSSLYHDERARAAAEAVPAPRTDRDRVMADA